MPSALAARVMSHWHASQAWRNADRVNSSAAVRGSGTDLMSSQSRMYSPRASSHRAAAGARVASGEAVRRGVGVGVERGLGVTGVAGPPADGDLLGVHRVAHDEVVRRRVGGLARRTGSRPGRTSPTRRSPGSSGRGRAPGRRPGPARPGSPRRSSGHLRPGRSGRARRPDPAARSRTLPAGRDRSAPGRPGRGPRPARPWSPRRRPGAGSAPPARRGRRCARPAPRARRRSSATTSEPEPSGAGSGAVSQPRAVSRSAACCNWGSGGASLAASLPRTWVWACSVSHVERHMSYEAAGQAETMAGRLSRPWRCASPGPR